MKYAETIRMLILQIKINYPHFTENIFLTPPRAFAALPSPTGSPEVSLDGPPTHMALPPEDSTHELRGLTVDLRVFTQVRGTPQHSPFLRVTPQHPSQKKSFSTKQLVG